MDKVVFALTIASAVVSGAIGVLALVAPLTKSEADNKALAKLRVVADVLGKLVGANVKPRA